MSKAKDFVKQHGIKAATFGIVGGAALPLGVEFSLLAAALVAAAPISYDEIAENMGWQPKLEKQARNHETWRHMKICLSFAVASVAALAADLSTVKPAEDLVKEAYTKGVLTPSPQGFRHRLNPFTTVTVIRGRDDGVIGRLEGRDGVVFPHYPCVRYWAASKRVANGAAEALPEPDMTKEPVRSFGDGCKAVDAAYKPLVSARP